jgi:NAD(P)-dependent dehydrogenase (short-subunit alcohol dehydrogenase family)
LAPQIQVNAIAPGIVLPPEGTSNKKQELWKEGNLLKKIGDPEEIAAALVFLLKSEFITGQVLFIDGGRHLKGSFYGT